MIESQVDEFAAELDQAGFIVSWAAKPYDGSSEFELYCPKHEDPDKSRSPSATWQPVAQARHFTRGVMHCHKPGCSLAEDASAAREQFKQRIGDNVVSLAGWGKGSRGKPPAATKGKKGKAKRQPTPTDETIREYMGMLEDEHKQKMLRDKGIKPDTLEEYEWGWIGGGKQCYIYPIRDRDNKIVGARLYDPFHPDRDKKRWYATITKNSNQLFGTHQAGNDDKAVVLFEGETDTMLAHQDGVLNAVTQTGGAGSWRKDFNWYFTGKIVYVCYDDDDAGRVGRQKVSKALEGSARAVRFVNLPGGDYCEWREAGHTVDDFWDLLSESEEVWRDEAAELPRTGSRMLQSVSELKRVSPGNRTAELQAYIAGKSDTSYDLPRDIVLSCNMDQGDKCTGCPLSIAGGEMRVSLRPDRDNVLVELMEAKSAQRHKLLRHQFGLHCDIWDSDETDQWYVEQVSLQDPVDSKMARNDDATFTANHFYSSDSSKLNTGEDYKVVGRTMSDPRNGRLAFSMWHADPVRKDLDKYEVTPEGMKLLKIHRPRRWTARSIGETLQDKYTDLANNVTGIVGRLELHLMYDLVAHSAISFEFNGRKVSKGWMDAIVMGDTRTGKTEVARSLNNHYMAGHLVSGENASYAGLIGGSAEMAGRAGRIALWGVLPRHDKRFVQIDEASGMQDLLPQMSSVRSSGIAEVNKQGGGRALARVRLLWLSNPAPKDGRYHTRSIENFRGGAAAAIQEMVGTQEDIARFDLAMAVTSADVDLDQILARKHGVPHRYSQEACHELIMFAWSRTPAQIRFEDGVEEYIADVTKEMSAHYTETPPLVQASDFNNKLARMAVALATLTYSTDDTGETVIVRRGHVRYLRHLVRKLYDAPLFGYGMESRKRRARSEMAKDSSEVVEDWLKGGQPPAAGLPPGVIVKTALDTMSEFFDPKSLAAACNTMNGDSIVNYFVKVGMMTRGVKYVDVEPELQRILRRIDGND